jgi:hypothetical protein
MCRAGQGCGLWQRSTGRAEMGCVLWQRSTGCAELGLAAFYLTQEHRMRRSGLGCVWERRKKQSDGKRNGLGAEGRTM